MADTTNTIPPEYNFPTYDFTYTVQSLHFDQATMLVEYSPVDTTLTKLSFAIPILANFDPANLTDYVTKWAPYNKWFAQKMLLTHGDNLIGANTNITVS
jgi:hypothetical protein